MADRWMGKTQFIGSVANALMAGRGFETFQSLQRRQFSKINLWVQRRSLPGFALVFIDSMAGKDW